MPKKKNHRKTTSNLLVGYPTTNLSRSVAVTRIENALEKSEQEIEGKLSELLMEIHQSGWGQPDKIMTVAGEGRISVENLLPYANATVRVQTMPIPRGVDAIIVHAEDEVVSNPLGAFGLPKTQSHLYRTIFYVDRQGRYLQCSVRQGESAFTFAWHDAYFGQVLANRFAAKLLIPERLQARQGLFLFLQDHTPNPEAPDQYIEWMLDSLASDGNGIPALAEVFGNMAEELFKYDHSDLSHREKINILMNSCPPISQQMLIDEVAAATDDYFDAKTAVERIFGIAY